MASITEMPRLQAHALAHPRQRLDIRAVLQLAPLFHESPSDHTELGHDPPQSFESKRRHHHYAERSFVRDTHTRTSRHTASNRTRARNRPARWRLASAPSEANSDLPTKALNAEMMPGSLRNEVSSRMLRPVQPRSPFNHSCIQENRRLYGLLSHCLEPSYVPSLNTGHWRCTTQGASNEDGEAVDRCQDSAVRSKCRTEERASVPSGSQMNSIGMPMTEAWSILSGLS